MTIINIVISKYSFFLKCLCEIRENVPNMMSDGGVRRYYFGNSVVALAKS